MLEHYLNPSEDEPLFINQELYQKLVDQFHQNAFETINKPDSKLRTYALFKKEEGQEKYLIEIKNILLRKQITRLRLSNHSLMIETGRHEHIPKEQRYCPFCKDQVETEVHFLFRCPTFSKLRNDLNNYIQEHNPNYLTLNDNERLECLMNNIDTHISKHIFDAFELRSFLVNNPKRLS